MVPINVSHHVSTCVRRLLKLFRFWVSLLRWLLLCFLVVEGYLCLIPSNIVEKQVISIFLLVEVQKRPSTEFSLLFVVVGCHFLYPRCTQFVTQFSMNTGSWRSFCIKNLIINAHFCFPTRLYLNIRNRRLGLRLIIKWNMKYFILLLFKYDFNVLQSNIVGYLDLNVYSKFRKRLRTQFYKSNTKNKL